MFARGARVTVRSHAGQEVKGRVICRVDAADPFRTSGAGPEVNDSGAWLVTTSSGRRVVSSAQMTARVSEGGLPARTDKIPR